MASEQGNDKGSDSEASIMPRPVPGAELCETTETFAGYWKKGAWNEPNRESALICMGEAVNGWKNLAYALARQVHYATRAGFIGTPSSAGTAITVDHLREIRKALDYAMPKKRGQADSVMNYEMWREADNAIDDAKMVIDRIIHDQPPTTVGVAQSASMACIDPRGHLAKGEGKRCYFCGAVTPAPNGTQSIADHIPQWYEGGTPQQMLDEAFAQIRTLEARLQRGDAPPKTELTATGIAEALYDKAGLILKPSEERAIKEYLESAS